MFPYQKIKITLVVVFTLIYSGCSKKKGKSPPLQDNCINIDSKFAAKVFPIIQNSCAVNSGCHGNGSTNGPGALTNFTQINNAESLVKYAVVSGRMPKNSTLSAEDKNTIACWVNNDAHDNLEQLFWVWDGNVNLYDSQNTRGQSEFHRLLP